MWQTILNAVSGGAIESAFEGIGTLAKDIRSAITGEISPEKKAEIEQKLMEMEFAAQAAQTNINLQESKHSSIFVAGWRPFIGWVCGSAIAYNFILNPLIMWGCEIYKVSAIPPVLDTGSLMTVVLSLLGLGGMRTFEKAKGVNQSHK